MDAQLDKLTLLIKDLLNVSRIESGKLAFQEDLFDLNEVVKETVEQIQMTTTMHRIRIEGRITCPIRSLSPFIGRRILPSIRMRWVVVVIWICSTVSLTTSFKSKKSS
jgi:signal transduction histidine kinase